MNEPLFLSNTDQVIVRCRECELTEVVERSDLPEGLPKQVFDLQARCSGCGAEHPLVLRLPPIVFH